MARLNLQTKLNVLFLGPVVLLFIVNAVVLLLAGLVGYLALSTLIFILVLTFFRAFFENMIQKLVAEFAGVARGVETLSYSASFLTEEFRKRSEEDKELESLDEEVVKIKKHLHDLKLKNEELLHHQLQLSELLFLCETPGLVRSMGQNRQTLFETQILLSASVKHFGLLSQKLEAGKRPLETIQKQWMILDCINSTTERMSKPVQELGLWPLVKRTKEQRLKLTPLREAIRRAEKRLA